MQQGKMAKGPYPEERREMKNKARGINNLEEKVSEYEISKYDIAKHMCKDVGRGVYKAGAATCKGVYKAGKWSLVSSYKAAKWSLISAVGTPEEIRKHVRDDFTVAVVFTEVVGGFVGGAVAAFAGAWPLAAAGGYAFLDGVARVASAFHYEKKKTHKNDNYHAGLVGLTRTSAYHVAKSLRNAPTKIEEHYKKKIIEEIEIKRNRQFNHIELYQKNPKLFRHYFDDLSNERKEKVLRDIIPICDTNVELKKYLEKNYAELIQKVGRDRITE